MELLILSLHNMLKALQSLIWSLRNRCTTLEIEHDHHICSHQPANGVIQGLWEPLLGSKVRQVMDKFDQITHYLQEATRLKNEFYPDPAY
jgi:hypothetical protein